MILTCPRVHGLSSLGRHELVHVVLDQRMNDVLIGIHAPDQLIAIKGPSAPPSQSRSALTRLSTGRETGSEKTATAPSAAINADCSGILRAFTLPSSRISSSFSSSEAARRPGLSSIRS